MKKYFFITAGSISLCLGMLGIFLPVLPTTPFLLLTAACYVRGSTNLYEWLMSHKRLGPYIESFREGEGILLRVKVISILTLWLAIGSSIVLIPMPAWIVAMLPIIATAVTLHISNYPTLRRG